MPIRRTIKNVVKNYSDAQVKVREATSNDPWGPSSTLMSEIADLSYNVLAFTEIMQMIWKRLNDHGKNWRHVYKALVVLDYIIKTGTEKVAQQCRENIFAIQTLKDFQFVDEGKDHGMNVREKAKQLVALLKDEERLKNERTKALKAKERFAQSAVGIGSSGGMKYSTSMGSSTIQSASSEATPDLPTSESLSNVSHELEAARPSTQGEEELQLELALAMSKEEADEDEKRRKQDDIKLQMAVEQSKGVTEPEPAPQQQDTLLDMAMGNTAQQRQTPADTWGAPTLPPPPTADPWDPSPAPQPAPQQTDPWSASPAVPPSLPPASTDQWSAASTPAKPDPWAPSQQPPQQSPWEPATANGAVTSGIDDEFDVITKRSPARSANTNPSNTQPTGNGAEAMSNNPWDMDGLQESLADQRAKNKSPADFLGANANLVNLDNLVSRPPKPANDNPFAMTAPPAPNPFGVQQQNNAARVPLNQMVNTSSMGFAQPVPSGTMLQQPLVPTGGLGQPQPNNPFM